MKRLIILSHVVQFTKMLSALIDWGSIYHHKCSTENTNSSQNKLWNKLFEQVWASDRINIGMTESQRDEK